jgi:hypothetical protein
LSAGTKIIPTSAAIVTPVRWRAVINQLMTGSSVVVTAVFP